MIEKLRLVRVEIRNENEELSDVLMLFSRISRQKSKLSSSTSIRLFSSSIPYSSKLKNYSFEPPLSLSGGGRSHQNPNPNHNLDSENEFKHNNKKKQKPLYRPPSSLDRTGLKPLHSDLPFDFRFSYTESSPTVRPIGLREPKYLPFGPGRLDRDWNGVCAPSVDLTVKSVEGNDDLELEEKRRKWRDSIQGEPLTATERKIIVEKCQRNRTKRQINLGRDGLTHNMLNDIHSHWKHAEGVRIKYLGVPTVGMKNVCTQLEAEMIRHRVSHVIDKALRSTDGLATWSSAYLTVKVASQPSMVQQLKIQGEKVQYMIGHTVEMAREIQHVDNLIENLTIRWMDFLNPPHGRNSMPLRIFLSMDKTGGKIIHRHGGLLVLYRGRNYNHKKRPVIPLMLWKPHEPIYPRLIKTVIDGLTVEETKEMRKRGLAVPALTKLAKNGFYGSLVPMVRDAFLIAELVRIDCKGLERSDYKKIGCRLR